MNFWEVFLGVAAGLAVGVIVNIIVNWLINIFKERKIINYFKYEIDINIEKINSFKTELQKYKEKVLSDSINTYFGWFYLSEIILTTINQIFYSGLIYRKFNYEDIEELQKFKKDFSISSEKYINDQVKENTTNFVQGNINVKQRALNQITFWENKFNEHRVKLENIKNKL
jgi:ABC-type lipoprotein release transport system permease subunit